jgi:hypothetical protein
VCYVCASLKVYNGRQTGDSFSNIDIAQRMGALERAERRFRHRLDRADDADASMLDFDARFNESSMVVSSPAIDALIMQVREMF